MSFILNERHRVCIRAKRTDFMYISFSDADFSQRSIQFLADDKDLRQFGRKKCKQNYQMVGIELNTVSLIFSEMAAAKCVSRDLDFFQSYVMHRI